MDLKLEEKDGSSNNENNSDKKETGRSSSYSETKDLEITKNKEKNKNKAIDLINNKKIKMKYEITSKIVKKLTEEIKKFS